MTTVVTTSRTGPFAANGVAPIPFSFQSLSETEIGVLREGVVADPSTYTVDRDTDGTGTITPLSDWGTDEVLIYSDPNYQQTTEFQRFGAFYPDLVNPPIDRLARSIIALKDGTYHTPLSPQGAGMPGVDADGIETFYPLDDFLAGPPGAPGGNVMAIGLFSNASGMTVPAGTELVQTSGHAALGVGAAQYVYDAAVDAAYVLANPLASFVDTGGRGFRLLSEQVLTPQMFGAVGDGVADDTSELQAFLTYLQTNNAPNRMVGTFKVSSGLTYGDGITAVASSVLYINAEIQASAASAIEKLLEIKKANHLIIDKLKLVGTGGTPYSGRTTGTGLWLDGVGRAEIRHLITSNFWYRGVYAYNDVNFSYLGNISADDCGSGIKRSTDPTASLTGAWTYGTQNGSANSTGQSTTIDVDTFYPEVLDSYRAVADAPIFARLYDSVGTLIDVFKITAVDRVGGTINVHPWINSTHASGTIDYIFGGGLELRGGDANMTQAGFLDCIRCGNPLALASLVGSYIPVVSSAYSGIGIIVGDSIGAAMLGGVLTGAYFEPNSNEVQIMLTSSSDSAYWQLLDEVGLEPDKVKVLGPVSAGYVPTPQLADANHYTLAWSGKRLEFEKPGTGYPNSNNIAPDLFIRRHSHVVVQSDTKTCTPSAPNADLNRLFGYSGGTIRAVGTGSRGRPTGTVTITAPGGYTVNGGASAAFTGFSSVAEISVEYVPGSTNLNAKVVAGQAYEGLVGTATVATNADFTLTAYASKTTQVHTGTLTADRAVTLSTTGAVEGNRFRIARSGGGAFNLNVGTGPLKALATGQWCDVEYNGAAWVLTAFGSL